MSKKITIIGDVHLSEASPRSWKVDYGSFMLEELSRAIALGDISICLGDLFHRPVVSEQYKLKLVQLIQSSGKPFYTIWGNHDVHNMNMDVLERTSTMLLAELGIINIITSSKVIEGVKFDVIPMRKNPTIEPLKEFTKDSVLLGHLFFEHPFDPKMSVTTTQLEESGYGYCILGHDHEPHKPFQFKDTSLLRPGSLARHTSHLYNLTRIPEVLVMTVSDLGTIESVVSTPIPSLPSSELFTEESFVKPVKNQSTFLSSVQDLLDRFSSVSQQGRMSLSNALREAKAPENVCEYLKTVFERQGLSF